MSNHQVTTPCIEYPGPRTPQGYGVIYLGLTPDGKQIKKLMHRHVWESLHGPIPAGINICHRCDNPPCYADDHLFPGTQADNLADMKAKGRDNRGMGGRPLKLSPEQIAAAVADPGTADEIADRMNVHASTVRRWRKLARSKP